MTGETTFPPADEVVSLKPDLDITIEGSTQNSEQLFEEERDNDLENEYEELFEIEPDDHDNNGGNTTINEIPQNHVKDDIIEGHEKEGNDLEIEIRYGKDYHPPIIGMEFESYDDAYNYYNLYAKQIGFAIRVKSSWTKRNSKEKRGAVLCCNCEGFKTVKEANSRRKETRTGCLAMIRLRLVESNRWRVDEVKLEHNHSFDPERAQNSKSHKRIDVGVKRKVEPTVDVEVRTIKLYRTSVLSPVGCAASGSIEGESNYIDCIYGSKHLKLEKGDGQVIHKFFSQAQLTNPNFFYVVDLNEEGYLRNVFWIDSRSRAAYDYFGDVVLFDTTCLSRDFEIPLFVFVGVNHHGQSILLGCGLLSDKSFETYVWLFRTWLTCMSGRTPQTIITDRFDKLIRGAIGEVFPRAHHRLCLSKIMQSILDNFKELQNFEAFQLVLSRVVYNSVKLEEFELGWEEMIQQFGIKHHDWLQNLFEDRERWVPIFVKDTFFAGMLSSDEGVPISPFFHGYVQKQTSLKEFFKIYDSVLEKKHQKESLDDLKSKESTPLLKTRCYYEVQLSKLYTNELFNKFQDEVAMMSSCFNITQVHTNGPIIIYLVKEREGEEILRDFEVIYDKAGAEVRCICGCYNYKGYLCRHSLCILNYNGVEEIPSQYILSRWRKDFKRLYVPGLGSNVIDITNPIQWFDHLCRRAMQVVEEGMISQDHYMVAWQAFKESLNKVRLVIDEHV